MLRDAEDLKDELAGENYYAALDEARERDEAEAAREREDEDEDEQDACPAWYTARAGREDIAAINAHAARIARARAELRAEMAEIDEKEAA